MLKFLLYFFLLIFATEIHAASDTIWWSSKRLLWSDFKGKWDTATSNKNHYATTLWKLTYYHRRNRQTGQVEVIAYAWFDGRRSWVRSSQRTNAALLQHEQGHFDLAEILARQFKKQVAQTQFSESSYADTLNRIFNILLADMNDRQLQYDIDTFYGGKAAEQRRWETYLATALEQTKEYAARRVLSRE